MDVLLTIIGERSSDQRLLRGQPGSAWRGHMLGEWPLVDGSRLVEGTDKRVSAMADGMPAGLLLTAVTGPCAGAEWTLSPGRHILGRAASADLRLEDAAVSRAHCQIEVRAGGVLVRDLDSQNGSEMDGTPLTGEHPWEPSSRLRVGASTLALKLATSPEVHTTWRDGRRHVHRPPRLAPQWEPAILSAPAEPAVSVRGTFPWTIVTLPLVVGVAISLLMRSPVAMLFGLMGPAMALVDWLTRRRGGGRRLREARHRHATELGTHHRLLAQHLVAERAARDELYPCLSQVRRQAALGPRLWERQLCDDDALTVRWGTGTLPAQTAVREGTSLTHPLLAAAAVTTRLDHATGIAGPTRLARALAQSIVGQLCVWHGPDDLAVIVLVDEGSEEDWEWAGFVPHLRSDHTGNAAIQILPRQGDHLVAARIRQLGPEQRVLVVHDRHGEHLPLASGDDQVIEVIVAADRLTLPSICRTVITLHDEAHATLDGQDRLDFQPDLISPSACDAIGRALGPLAVEARSGLPALVTLSELTGTPQTTALHDRWSRMDDSLVVTIGMGSDGPTVIDLCRDGPHVLVGGTTGSGKSEFLRTLVASLAANYAPSQVAFLLVDYKGGAAFRECAQLPHTAAVVTDLDADLAERALTTLHAELKRRERLLASTGSDDISSHNRAGGDLARLIVVIDEFRSLTEDLPQFVHGMVRVAALGRSLGIHLVLATQRPHGVVTPDIRANMNLRVALRMRDRSDSQEVIDDPRAAELSTNTPGRAFLRIGGGPVMATQTALSTHAVEAIGTASTVERTDGIWLAAERPAPSSEQATDLRQVMLAANDAAVQRGDQRPRAPWQEPLPECLAPIDSVRNDTVVLGLVDRPTHQDQFTLDWGPADGHLLVAGRTGSGRASICRSIVVDLCARHTPDDLEIHLVDGRRSLGSACASIPHVGSMSSSTQPQMIATLIHRLASLPRPVPKRMVIIIDGWEAVEAALHSSGHSLEVETLLGLVRDCSSDGLQFVITGTTRLLCSKLAGLCATAIALASTDSGELAVAGLRPAATPREWPAGRGLHVASGLWVQLVHRSLDLLAAQVTDLATRHQDPRHLVRLRELPEQVLLDDLVPAPESIPLGLCGDDASSADLPIPQDGRPLRLLIIGGRGSGRSTAIATVCRGLGIDRAPVRLTETTCASGKLVMADDADTLSETDRAAIDRATLDGTSLVLTTSLRSAAQSYRGAIRDLLDDGYVLVLGAVTSTDIHALGLPLERVTTSPPGRGQLVHRGRSLPIQIAQATAP